MTVDTQEELRLAIVLNGGVSLAVWISGVVNELDALRYYDPGQAPESDATGGIYASLKGLLRLNVVVDIVAGTSAGGLNGALLAAGVATRKRISSVRDIWLDAGQLSELLRNPSESDPQSLLKGDEKLLPAVEDAIKAYFQAPDGTGPTGAIQATLTCTDLFGVPEQHFLDSYGDAAERTERRLHQRFHTDGDGGDGALLVPGSVGALARAARSSASFPFAFEPSELSAGDAALASAVYTYDHSVMPLAETTVSRWVMDGGVLDNSPIDVVLEDVRKRSVMPGAAVRRSVVFVVPYAGQSKVDTPGADGANLRRVLDTTINSPRDLPDLENLDRARRRLERRDGRLRHADDVLLQMGIHELRDLANLCQALPAADVDPRIPNPSPPPEDAARRIGRRVLERTREARANLPIAPKLPATQANLDAAREGLRLAQQGIHTSIWSADDEAARVAEIAGYLNDARAAITDNGLDVRRSVGNALQLGAPRATAERLANADKALLVMAGVSAEEQATDVGFQFMRLCADARHLGQPVGAAFDSRQPTAKLYGLELGHFGGFVRRSWRANDWMWGRLDGAARLVDLILDPAHLSDAPVSRQNISAALRAWLIEIGMSVDQFNGLLCSALAADENDPTVAGHGTLDDGPAFGFTGHPLDPGDGLIHPGHANPSVSPDWPSKELRTWRHGWRIVIQAAILRAELPLLTTEVAKDLVRGFRPNPSPEVKVDTPTTQVVEKFQDYCKDLRGNIHEIVEDEADSSQGARLVATAIAVTASVLSSKTSGFPGLIKAALRTTRGALKVARFAVNAMTGSVLQRTAFVIGVALAGLAIGLTTISDLGGPSGSSASSTSSASGSSSVMGIAFAVAMPVLVIALAGAIRPARRRRRDRIAGLLFGAGAALALLALAMWLWAAPLNVASGVASAHSVWSVVIVLVAISTVVGWVATVRANFKHMLLVVCLVLVAAAAAVAWAVPTG